MNYHQELTPEGYYHIYNRTVGKEQPLKNSEEIHNLLGRFKRLLTPYMDILSYAILINHYHLITRVKPIDLDLLRGETSSMAKRFLADEVPYSHFLSDQFRRLQLGYTKRYNRKYGRTGSLWQARFKRVSISEIQHLVRKITYVHHNGLHHLGHRTYLEYPHTSYHAVISDKPTSLAREHVLELFKQNEKSSGLAQFIAYHEAYRQDWRTDYEIEKQL